jgi:hypothetical protein
MDEEVAKTLGELELKLQELEHELTSLGHRDTPRHRGGIAHEQENAPGGLIDEAIEHNRKHVGDVEDRTAEEAVADGDGFGGPAVWGGEEVPARAGATVERDWSVEVRETAYGEIPIPPPRAPDPPNAFAAPQEPWPPHVAEREQGTERGHVSGLPHVPDSPYASEPPRTTGASETQHAVDPPYAPPPPTHPFLQSSPGVDDGAIDVADLERFRDKLTSATSELMDEYDRLLSRIRARQRAGS